MKIDVLSSESLYENVLTQRGQELNESWSDIVSPEQTVQLTLINYMISAWLELKEYARISTEETVQA